MEAPQGRQAPEAPGVPGLRMTLLNRLSASLGLLPRQRVSMPISGSGTREAAVAGNGAWSPARAYSFAPAALSSQVMLPLRLGEAAGEFTDVTGADQLTHARVTGRRQCPVIACCTATPDPPLRVLAPEPLEPVMLVARAVSRRSWRAMAGRDTAGSGRTRPGWPHVHGTFSLTTGSAMPASRESGSPPGRTGAKQVRRGVTAMSSGPPRLRGPVPSAPRTKAGRKVLSCVSASALAYRIRRLIGAAEYLTPGQAAGAAVVMAGGSRLLADEQPA